MMTTPRAIHDTSGRLWIEEGEQREGPLAEVAPLIRTPRRFTFAIPDSLQDAVSVGQRVRVPMGRRGRLVEGFVVGIDVGRWGTTIRPIDSVIDPVSFLTPDLIELGKEIALHYVCPLGRTLKSITPEAVRKERGLRSVRCAALAMAPEKIAEDSKRITAQRRAILDGLTRNTAAIPVARLLADTKVSAGVLHGMVKAGWVRVETHKELSPVEGSDEPTVPLVEPSYLLNDEQRTALEAIHTAIEAGRFSVTLMFGVSGSGKTEVYVHAIRRVVAQGRQAILLVPEIVLTTQLVRRLASRFRDVAVMHSGLTGVQRSLMWRRVEAGRSAVVIGTRSAVFAPCPNLGLICVDEEQETSFKNLQAPRFNVRDVAIMRAKQLGIPVVLGSATPSVETWYHSEHREDYQRVVLRKRINELPMPKVHIVDMRDECLEMKRHLVFSRTMGRLLGEALERGEQAILLVNRRGFANRIFCPECKTNLTCPNCNVSLVVHAATGHSVCHYCRSRIPTPARCPNVSCGAALVPLGFGTQRVEDVLAERFSGTRVQRVDSDTMRHRDHYQRIVDDFEARRIDVLVGTQMIAKGLDFPYVSFVGAVHADPTSLANDFRSAERLFHLITQVAGRAGRADRPGQVVVQTTTPELPALRCALAHDFESFVRNELPIRRRAGFPPFRRLARVVLAHAREEVARQEADAMVARVRETIAAQSLELSDVLGPNACPLSRLRGKYRYEMLIRTPNATTMRNLTTHLQKNNTFRSKAQSVTIDVDPVSLV